MLDVLSRTVVPTHSLCSEPTSRNASKGTAGQTGHRSALIRFVVYRGTCCRPRSRLAARACSAFNCFDLLATIILLHLQTRITHFVAQTRTGR
jgi:hypothetical protein